MLLSHTKKPSKAQAFELVKILRAGTRELTAPEIDSLINFFAPSPPAAAKTPEQWVVKAAARGKEPRSFLRFMHVKAGIARASDGHRIHRAKTTLSDGAYCPRAMLPVAVPEQTSRDANRLDGLFTNSLQSPFSVEDLTTTAHSFGKETFHVVEVAGVFVNRRYLLEALNGVEQFTAAGKSEKLEGRGRFGDFVIMGVRQK